MKQTFQKITLVAFWILVALLALYLTVICGFNLFQEDGRFSLTEGFIVKFIIFIIYADMPLLFAAGITSIISFFKKGTIWKPLIKAIILNVAILLLIVCITICDFKLFPGLSVITTTITGALLWCLFSIYKITKRL